MPVGIAYGIHPLPVQCWWHEILAMASGDVNERDSTLIADADAALLVHTIFGIDKYNRELYLRKFSTAQLDEVLAALQRQQAIVARARDASAARDEQCQQFLASLPAPPPSPAPMTLPSFSLESSGFVAPALLAALDSSDIGGFLRRFRGRGRRAVRGEHERVHRAGLQRRRDRVELGD